MTDRYILWVQESLNKILKLRLKENGSIGSDTRSAVRSFQLKQRLPLSPDGVVCPETEQALIAAGANSPPSIMETRGHETPRGRTVYVDIPLQIPLGNATSMTGVFFPENYCPVPKVDLIVFLHGWKVRSHKPEYSIDMYWHLPEFRVREEVNISQKNVILVAPTLGPKNEPGSLTCSGGFDKFLGQVMTALKQYGPYAGTKITPSIGNIILACHSGSWQVMEAIAKVTDTYVTQIREYWAFDPESMSNMWKDWAKSHSTDKLYIYYGDGRAGQQLCKQLIGKNIPKSGKISCMKNVLGEMSTVKHDDIPRVYLKDRIQGAPFLVDKSKCPSSGTRQRTSATRKISRLREVPFDLSTDLEGMEIWNSNLAEEVWQAEGAQNSPAYIRWVQHSLNQIMRLKLGTDGILDTQTRSAIRSFQKRQGLKVNGIVGSRTEAAIKAALIGSPTMAAPATPTKPTSPSLE